jgi:LytS/YehU family sensor histidine kinase
LLLQPLVENAIKHGITPHPPGGELLIRAQEKDREIWLEVRNTGAPLGSRRGGGLGLRNLEARLPLVHGPEARFQISSVNGWTVAMVRLPKERYA